MEPVDVALARFEQGYSCSQAVFSALAEQRGVAPELALRIAAGFGGGIGRTAGTCGCVTGAIMALGLDQPSVAPEENKKLKEKTCAVARQFMDAFAARHGSTVCRELLGCDIGTPEGMQQARDNKLFQVRCTNFVRGAVEIASA